jgi:hypothetical protein
VNDSTEQEQEQRLDQVQGAAAVEFIFILFCFFSFFSFCSGHCHFLSISQLSYVSGDEG